MRLAGMMAIARLVDASDLPSLTINRQAACAFSAVRSQEEEGEEDQEVEEDN